MEERRKENNPTPQGQGQVCFLCEVTINKKPCTRGSLRHPMCDRCLSFKRSHKKLVKERKARGEDRIPGSSKKCINKTCKGQELITCLYCRGQKLNIIIKEEVENEETTQTSSPCPGCGRNLPTNKIQCDTCCGWKSVNRAIIGEQCNEIRHKGLKCKYCRMARLTSLKGHMGPYKPKAAQQSRNHGNDMDEPGTSGGNMSQDDSSFVTASSVIEDNEEETEEDLTLQFSTATEENTVGEEIKDQGDQITIRPEAFDLPTSHGSGSGNDLSNDGSLSTRNGGQVAMTSTALTISSAMDTIYLECEDQDVVELPRWGKETSTTEQTCRTTIEQVVSPTHSSSPSLELNSDSAQKLTEKESGDEFLDYEDQVVTDLPPREEEQVDTQEEKEIKSPDPMNEVVPMDHETIANIIREYRNGNSGDEQGLHETDVGVNETDIAVILDSLGKDDNKGWEVIDEVVDNNLNPTNFERERAKAVTNELQQRELQSPRERKEEAIAILQLHSNHDGIEMVTEKVKEFRNIKPKRVRVGPFEVQSRRKNKVGTEKFRNFLRKTYSFQRARAMAIIRDPYKDDDKVPPLSEVKKVIPQPQERDEEEIENLLLSCRPPATETLSMGDFTIEEVKERFKTCNNSGPGIDGLSYRDWKAFDPSFAVVTVICNIVLRMKSIPQEWKMSRIKLLPKKEGAKKISDFRPIGLQQSIYKIYSGLLGRRFSDWMERNGRLDRGQRGFRAMEGCHENNFLLKTALAEARKSGGELNQISLAWLDLSNAFTSIETQVIKKTLETNGVGREFLDIIMDIYANQKALCVGEVDGTHNQRGRRGKGKKMREEIEIPVKRGKIQGDPISPLIANLVFDTLLQQIKDEDGIKLFGHFLAKMGFADDIVLLADGDAKLSIMLKSISDAATTIGLTFNQNKSMTLSIKDKKRLETGFILQGKAVPAMKKNSSYKYLGCKQAFELANPNTFDQHSIYKDMLRDVELIHYSGLYPLQKVDALKTFVIPKLNFLFREEIFSKFRLERLEGTIRRHVRSWIGIGAVSSTEMLHLPIGRSGMGLLNIRDTYHAACVSHGLKLLKNEDERIRSIAIKVSNKYVPEVETGSSIFERIEQVAKNIKRELSKKDPISRMINAAYYLNKISEDLKVAFKSAGSIDCTSTFRSRSPPTDLSAGRGIRWCISEWAKEQVGEMTTTKGNLTSCWEDPASTQWIREGKMNWITTSYALSARTDTLSLRGRKYKSLIHQNREVLNCRRCHTEVETNGHVQGACRFGGKLRLERHEKILRRVINAIPKKVQNLYAIFKEKPVGYVFDQCGLDLYGTNKLERPDLLLVNLASKEVHIIDITTCSPSSHREGALEEARQIRKKRYANLQRAFEANGYFTMQNDAYVVGVNGAFKASNNEVTRLLGISTSYAKKMAHYAVCDAITFSARIYEDHIGEGHLNP